MITLKIILVSLCSLMFITVILLLLKAYRMLNDVKECKNYEELAGRLKLQDKVSYKLLQAAFLIVLMMILLSFNDLLG